MTLALNVELWRRPGCGDDCWRAPALVIGEQFKRMIESHDPDTHEAYARDHRAAAITRTGPLVIDAETFSVSVDGVPVPCTVIETRLLLCLTDWLGRLCPARVLLTQVWGAAYTDERHLLRVNIARLRAKLGDAASMIQTRPGAGYLLSARPPCPSTAIERWQNVGNTLFRQDLVAALNAAPARRLTFPAAQAAASRTNHDTRVSALLKVLDRAIAAGERLAYRLPTDDQDGEIWLLDQQP